MRRTSTRSGRPTGRACTSCRTGAESPTSTASRSQPAHARTALGDRAVLRWLASELLANAAWAGTLVYAGALFAESYGTSTELTGSLLAVAAGSYVAGNLACRRLVGRDPRRVLILLAVCLAVTDSLFGIVRSNVATSTALLSSAAFAAGGRTLIASAFALSAPPHLRPAVTSLRAATMQFGYVVGSIAGGAALTVSGYGALGATMGFLFLSAALTLGKRPTSHRTPGGRPEALSAARAPRGLSGQEAESTA